MHHPDSNELKFVHSPRPAIARERIVRTLRTVWNLDGVISDVGGDRDQNLVVTAASGERYLLKIAQTDEDPEVLDLPVAALRHVALQAPDLPVPRVVPTVDGSPTHAIAGDADARHVLRLFTYLPGQPIASLPRTAPLLHALGASVAQLDRALRGFFHRHGDHALLWDIRQAGAIRAYATAIADHDERSRLLDIIDEFTEITLPRLAALRAQIIHGDITGDNALADGEPTRVTGLIDFGDVVHAPLVQELAIAMADTTYGLDDPWTAACAVAAGYDEVTRLEGEEIALLHDLARVRVALTIPILAARERHRDEGAGSLAGSMNPCRRQLDAFDTLGRERALAQLRRALRAATVLPASPPFEQAANAERRRLLERRERDLMPGLALFYPEDPLHVVRGEGVWLFDAEGRQHLDCYNNVPQVGHAHPHVVNAVARQAAALNTNTRYLYDSILEYTEELAARLPGELGVALFVNSGSEANDLAWQIAKACTGGDGALVTSNAYHGITEATLALSPYGLPPDKISAAHVARLNLPNGGNTSGRQPGLDDFDAREADRAIAALAEHGHRLAAFMVDPTLSSDGILDPPEHYFRQVAETVRAAGGLCIADEVQSGFGRMGTWWGFEARGFTPDIVTLGKPIANGYPMGVVVTTPAIMAAFAEKHDCFSTFGGNPVACMAALAVIDVIERDRLCAHAAEVGRYLKDGLSRLADQHPCIGDVRGRGLFVGVELAHANGDPKVAADLAAATALALRQRGILVGIEGPRHNVLKIRPPLVFESGHADRLVDTLSDLLKGGA